MAEFELRGVFAVKLPVSDLARSVAWYERVLGFQAEIEFPDDDGVVRGVAGHLPGVPDTFWALREDPATAKALAGANVVNLAVKDRAAVEAWAAQLDHLGINHSPLIDATIGWMLVVRDPDGIELHLYSQQPHGIEQSRRPGYGRPCTAPTT
jgi:catechol 2,3-dioxygenase-like lactoylglutathione lyase family enzyme